METLKNKNVHSFSLVYCCKSLLDFLTYTFYLSFEVYSQVELKSES